MIRAFIALTVSEDLIQYLNSVIVKFSSLDFKASWTKPGNFHITLKFLGDIKEDLVPVLSKSLSEIDISLPSRFQLGGISGFPSLNNPRVLWYGIKDGTSFDLHKKVQDVCLKYGFEIDKKPFRPHMTLGRIKSNNHDGLKDTISKIPEYNEICNFEKFALIKSELTKKGPIYTNLWIKD